MGRRVLITGGSRGIGAAIAAKLAGDGWEVVIVSRTAGLAFDVARPDWPALGPLDGLVCAAGVLEPIGTADAVDPAAFRRTLEVNLLGAFHAMHHALPSLRERRGAIVTFSGGGATGPLPRFDAYAASKAAVVRLTENVAAAEPGVRANAVAPGFVATDIHAATLDAGPERVGDAYFARTQRDLVEGGAGTGPAAELTAFLLSEAAAGITGKLLSAPWDPWREPGFQQRLRDEPDLATLRRIDDQFFTTQPSS